MAYPYSSFDWKHVTINAVQCLLFLCRLLECWHIDWKHVTMTSRGRNIDRCRLLAYTCFDWNMMSDTKYERYYSHFILSAIQFTWTMWKMCVQIWHLKQSYVSFKELIELYRHLSTLLIDVHMLQMANCFNVYFAQINGLKQALPWLRTFLSLGPK